MLRIFSTLLRGLRSTKPSQCCPQESTDEVSCTCKREATKIQAAQFRYYTAQGQYFSSVRNHQALIPGKFIKWSFNHEVKCHTGIQAEEADDHVRTRVTPELQNQRPPWLWHCLLDQCSEEASNKEGHRSDKEGSQDCERTCQKEQFIHKHSILQGLGWGSAVALTWSVYRDGVDNKCYPFWHNKYHEPNTHTVRIKKPTLIYQHEGTENTHHEKCRPSCFDGKKRKGEPLQNLDGADTCRWHGKSESTNSFQTKDNDFQNAYTGNKGSNNVCNTNSEVPARKETVRCKEQAKHDILDPFLIDESSDSDISDIENAIKNLCKFKIKEPRSDEKEARFQKATLCLQNDSIKNYKTDSGCGSDCSNNLTSDGTVEKQNDGKVGKEIRKISRATSTADLGFKGTGTQTSTPVSTQRREEVLVEDCPEDDHNDSRGTSSHEYSHQPSSGINQFSDSLLELLAAGKEEIRSIQAQYQGVLESDIGVTLAEENPEQAVVFFRAGALLGDPSSIFNLALCYHTGHGVTQDYAVARHLYEASSLAGHGWGTYNLAVMVSRGEGGAVDTEQAYRLLIMAGLRGVKEAQEALSQCHQHSCEKVKLRYTQSEPNLAATPSDILPSSNSTSDLLFMEESDIEFGSDFSRDIVNLDVQHKCLIHQ